MYAEYRKTTRPAPMRTSPMMIILPRRPRLRFGPIPPADNLETPRSARPGFAEGGLKVFWSGREGPSVGGGARFVFLGERGHGDKGREDPPVGDPKRGPPRPHEGRKHVVAGGRPGGVGPPPAVEDLRALAFRDVHVLEDALLMVLRGERPHLGFLVQRVADAEGSDARQERVEEFVPHRFMQEDPGPGDARLSLIVECGEQGPLDRGVQIRVVEDDVRSLPAELEERPLQVGRGLPHDLLADLDRTGETDLAASRLAGKRRPPDPALAATRAQSGSHRTVRRRSNGRTSRIGCPDVFDSNRAIDSPWSSMSRARRRSNFPRAFAGRAPHGPSKAARAAAIASSTAFSRDS